MMNAKTPALMKDGAVLINLTRGDAVDIEALVDALRSARLRGAAVDVFPTKPGSSAEPIESPLRGLET